MTREQVIEMYNAQGTDIVNDHEFRSKAISMTEFSLMSLQDGMLDGTYPDEMKEEANVHLEQLLDILRAL